jgi:hypothetical protein
MKMNILLGLNLILLSVVVHADIKDITIKHTVKSGETMHSITRHYLNTDLLWMDNWKLNPHVDNPNNLSIGQVLTVIEQRFIPAEKATMLDIINNVDRKLIKGNWLAAKVGDELQQQEGVRTLEKSSTVLKFNETSSLKVLEFSQIFLQSRSTSLTGTDSSTIEIIQGDAELSWKPMQIETSEIEIISGKTKLTPSNVHGKKTTLRTGLAKNGNSVVSVYNGTSNVESAGSQIIVPKGMGVSVKQGQKPPKPSPLLKSPILVSTDGLVYNYTNPILEWHTVDKASQYLIEVCPETDCNKVILQGKTNQNKIQITSIHTLGNYYWRVAAISDDEIVGFKSKINKMVFSTNNSDNEGPQIALNLLGKKIFSNNKLIIAPNSKVQIVSIDSQAGLESLVYKWNQGEFSKLQDNSTIVNMQTGDLTIKAHDKLGNESQSTYQIKYL